MKVGLLYDNISGNLGDLAIGLSVKRILADIKIEFEELVPGRFNPNDYETIVIGGGHLLRPSPDFFYDKFRISGNHILNACGIVGRPDDLHYLDRYKYVSVRSTGDKRKLGYLKRQVNVVPCTSMLLNDVKDLKVSVKKPSLGVHLSPGFLQGKSEEAFVKWISSLGLNVYFLPITHYNRDFIYLNRLSSSVENSEVLPILKAEEAFTVIGQFNYFITCSLHGAMFSYVHNVPFIVSDWEKMRFFMEDRGLTRYLFADFEAMKRAFRDLQNERPNYSKGVFHDRELLRKHARSLRDLLPTSARKVSYSRRSREKVQSVLDQTYSQVHSLQMQVMGLEAQIRREVERKDDKRLLVSPISLPDFLKQIFEGMDLEEEAAESTRRLEPLFVLLAVYLGRQDLQEAFPEVRQGDLENLLNWAAAHGTSEDSARGLLSPYREWFDAQKQAIADSKKSVSGLLEALTTLSKDIDLHLDEIALLKQQNSRLLADLAVKERLAKDFEGKVSSLEQENSRLLADLAVKEKLAKDIEAERIRLGDQLSNANRELAQRQSTIQSLGAERTMLAEDLNKAKHELSTITGELDAIRQSFGYHVMRIYAKRIDRLFPEGTKRGEIRKIAVASFGIVVRKGIRSFLTQVWEKLKKREFRIIEPKNASSPRQMPVPDPNDLPAYSPAQCRLWMSLNQPSPESLEQMRLEARRFAYRPRISVCMPVHNVEGRYLSKALASVRNQVYENWELIAIDDGSDQRHVRSLLMSSARQDERIKVRLRDKNEGIPKTLNQAFAEAKGDVVVIMDHDDTLEPNALYEIVRHLNEKDWDLIYSDEALVDKEDQVFYIHFRPDFSPDFLLSHQYFVHLVALRRSLLKEIGGSDETFPNVAWDYDLWLRAAARTTKIGHIPKVLYRWRRYETSASHVEKEKVMKQSKIALEKAMKLMNIQGTVEDGLWFNYFRVRRKLKSGRLSIIIPTRTAHLLDRCIGSIESKTNHKNYEIIIVANNVNNDDSKSRLEELASKHRVLYYDGPFNFSAINNYAASMAKGEHLLFLNDDTEVLAERSIEAMLEHSQREEVGAVGAKLLFPNNTIQHAGVVIGLFDSCEHVLKFTPSTEIGYYGSLIATRNYSAVTAACTMIPRRVFQEVGGFDERLAVVFNDIDLCLRIRSLGYLIVYTPYAVFYHHEHASRRGVLPLHPVEEDMLFKERWKELIVNGDPYYNPNLSRWHYDCRPRFDTMKR